MGRTLHGLRVNSRLEVLPYGPRAAQHYGAIRATLEKLGQPIGVNDLHIAGHARDWSPMGQVTLNPERDSVIAEYVKEQLIQPLAAQTGRQLA